MYRISYDILDDNRCVHAGYHEDHEDLQDAQDAYNRIASDPHNVNVRKQTFEPEEHYVEVAFKTYDYVVKGKVKKGNTVEVVVNGHALRGKVVGITSKKDLDYKEAKVVKGKW